MLDASEKQQESYTVERSGGEIQLAEVVDKKVAFVGAESAQLAKPDDDDLAVGNHLKRRHLDTTLDSTELETNNLL